MQSGSLLRTDLPKLTAHDGHLCAMTKSFINSNDLWRLGAAPVCLCGVFTGVLSVSDGLNGDRGDAPRAIQFGLVWGARRRKKEKTYPNQVSTKAVAPGFSE